MNNLQFDWFDRVLKVCSLQNNPLSLVFQAHRWDGGLSVHMADSLLKFGCQWDSEPLNKRPVLLPALPPDHIMLSS